mmetsp:Transcript_715/g.1541  ORF Transcript_715/g.1541 Transcript_715/m.1541 type:complete len:245 (-) Transcript_715:303-1037(-)
MVFCPERGPSRSLVRMSRCHNIQLDRFDSCHILVVSSMPSHQLGRRSLSTAPTDDAFAALPNGTLDSLLLPENKDELARILSYHVVQGNVHSSTITADVDVTTLSGHDVSASIPSEADGTFRLNNGAANVIFPDFLASNGIIHVIDAVLIPPEEDNVTTATNTTAMSMTTAITTTAADSVADDGETETDATEMSAATTTTTVAPGEETVGEGEETVEGDSGAGMNNALGALGVLVAASWSMNWW